MKIYRQGDVLVIREDFDVKGKKEIEREGGRVVLAHGEVTGHSHAIPSPHASLYLDDSTQAAPDVINAIARIGGGLIPDRILEARKPVSLLHEEHDTIELPAGTYRVRIQREYSPSELRNVAD